MVCCLLNWLTGCIDDCDLTRLLVLDVNLVWFWFGIVCLLVGYLLCWFVLLVYGISLLIDVCKCVLCLLACLFDVVCGFVVVGWITIGFGGVERIVLLNCWFGVYVFCYVIFWFRLCLGVWLCLFDCLVMGDIMVVA